MSILRLLDKRCDIEVKEFVQNNLTGEKEYSWNTLYLQISCRLRTRTVVERFSSKQEFVRMTHILYLPFVKIEPEISRVSLGGNYYDILGQNDMAGMSRYLKLYLERKA